MEPCKFFLQGRCIYGSACKNRHEAAALADPALKSLVSTIPRENEDQDGIGANLKSCVYFAVGNCKYGAQCRNKHSPGDDNLSWRTTVSQTSVTAQQTNVAKLMCRNFQQGNCVFGLACRFRHENENKLTDRAKSPITGRNDPSFQWKRDVPSFKATTVPPAAFGDEDYTRPSCRFFAAGNCKLGSSCTFRHMEINKAMERLRIHEPEQDANARNSSLPVPNGMSLAKIIHEAEVHFSDGGVVSQVKLSSDISSIQILGLPNNVRQETIIALLGDYGYAVPASKIQIKTIGTTSTMAEVRVEDPKFSDDISRRFKNDYVEQDMKKVSVKPILETGVVGSQGNRLQLSSVSCTWYQPSRPAWLKFISQSDAEGAKRVLKRRRIFDRELTVSFQESSPIPYFRRGYTMTKVTLQVGNLDVRTTPRHFKNILKGSLEPEDITIGTPSHSLSSTGAANVVKQLLNESGELESFQFQTLPGSNKVRASATFFGREGAINAVKALHNKQVPRLGNSKLFVSNVISVKYNIPILILDSVKPDLDRLKEEFWQNGHTHLKVYPPSDATKKFTAVRVFGEAVKQVAEAKAALEVLFHGSVVMMSGAPLWDEQLSATASMQFFEEIHRIHGVYVRRDSRNPQLLMYGGSPTEKSNVEKLLENKIRSLQELCYEIVLTPPLLKKAMQGGMKRIKGRFGNNAVLNVTKNPKTIKIIGSNEDQKIANQLLVDESEISKAPIKESYEDCVVCWTSEDDSWKTNCGHVYCKDCFSSQCSSSDGIQEIRCHGTNCEHIFSLVELQEMLSFKDFEDLLQVAFEAYIRTRPTEFHHCPTPDCPQIYRVTTNGDAFFCTACLSNICTSCNVVNHDGMTCADFQDLSSEGTKAFQKWKKENDVRDCPVCKSPIEKSFGCNHMECRQCNSHMCWFCMKVFETGGGVYEHMGKAHNSINGGGF